MDASEIEAEDLAGMDREQLLSIKFPEDGDTEAGEVKPDEVKSDVVKPDEAEVDSEKVETPEKVEPEKEPEPKETKTEVEDPEESVKAAEKDDITEHISPPEKWIQKRVQARANKEISAKAEALESELAEAKQRIEWLKTTGVDVDKMPIDAMSDEKIEAAREEFGDDIADMFLAARTALAKGPTAKSVEPAKSAETPQTETVEAIETAIQGNDTLSFWREKSPELWSKAVAQNDNYQKLSPEKRFEYVVQEVKHNVLEAKKAGEKKEPEKETVFTPPSSLSNVGAAPTAKQDDSALGKLGDDVGGIYERYQKMSLAEKAEIAKTTGFRL